jgi:mRNA interferase RelE/StbE
VYAVFLAASAERDLKRLDASSFRRIVERISGLAEDPRPPGCRKLFGGEREWRIRVGDFRVVYEVDDHASEVRVMRVHHRREAYR